ncbi:MAG: MFS transporter [Burkholderiales bacterium]
MPGSPASLAHSMPVRIAYACVAVLIGLTGGLGAGLVAANMGAIQGQLGLTSVQGAWLPAAYVMVNVTANLLVFKFRQQYGIRLFAELGLSLYAIVTLLHLFVEGFEMAVAVRAVSGLVSAATSTLAVLYMLQAFSKAKLGAGLVVGLTIAQLATPLAWLLSPAMLDLGDWRTLYQFEAGLALCSLAAVVVLKLPLGMRIQVLEALDFLTFALVAPGVALLAAVLVQGVNGWWQDTAWLGWALIASIVLLTTAGVIEYQRKTPLLQIRWLLDVSTLRFILGALLMRFMLSEQTYGAVGLLRTLGMGPDQLQPLYAVMLAGMICGMAVSAITFGQKTIVLQILLSVVLIAVGGWLDHQSTSMSRPHDFFLSQFLLSFASAMFMGPVLMIGIMQALKFGADHMITFMVLFAMTQSLGGLLGPAVLGTMQAERTQVYVQSIGSHLDAGNPAVVQRLAQQQGGLAGRVTDPSARAAQAAAQLGQVVHREASVRAFNDVFAVIAAMALVFLAWSLYRVKVAAGQAKRAAAAAPAPAPSRSAGAASI